MYICLQLEKAAVISPLVQIFIYYSQVSGHEQVHVLLKTHHLSKNSQYVLLRHLLCNHTARIATVSNNPNPYQASKHHVLLGLANLNAVCPIPSR